MQTPIQVVSKLDLINSNGHIIDGLTLSSGVEFNAGKIQGLNSRLES